MSEHSKIEWCDSTWNPVRGCTRVSPGCGGPGKAGGCYAEAMAARFSKPGQWGHGFAEMRGGEPRWTGKVALIEDPKILLRPYTWKQGRRIFVNSTSDLFHEGLSDWARLLVFAVMAMTYDVSSVDESHVITGYRQRHVYQVLTKRPAIMRRFVTELVDAAKDTKADRLAHQFSEASQRVSRALGHPAWMNAPFCTWQWVVDGMPGLWLGTSCEDQPRADERIPELLGIPAAVRFVSYEPALGPVNFEPWLHDSSCELNAISPDYSGRICTCSEPREVSIDWIISGGESGPDARPAHPDWFRKVRDDCAAASVAYFHKQNGIWVQHTPSAGGDLGGDCRAGRVQIVHVAPHTDQELLRRSFYRGDIWMERVGKARAGRLLDGREHNEMPDTRSAP